LLSWSLGVICGGSVATGVQLVTTGTRAISSATTAGIGNPIISTLEAAGSVIISITALFIPLIMGIGVLLMICCLFCYVVKKGGSFFKRKETPGLTGSC